MYKFPSNLSKIRKAEKVASADIAFLIQGNLICLLKTGGAGFLFRPTHSQVNSSPFCPGLRLRDRPLLFLSCWQSGIGLVNPKPLQEVERLEEREIPGRYWGLCDNSSMSRVPFSAADLLRLLSAPLFIPFPGDGRVPATSPGDGALTCILLGYLNISTPLQTKSLGHLLGLTSWIWFPVRIQTDRKNTFHKHTFSRL